MRQLSLCLIVACLAAPAFAQNNCGNPYWAKTLRCQAFPGAAPQANLGTIPAAGDIHAFTRVFLTANSGIRCADGTMPLIYVDKAVGATSNNWIISFTGGGSVAAADTNADGIADDAQLALDIYADPLERDEMGSALKPPMKELDGINTPDSILNPVFSNYNRVRIEKCSYDRYMGRVAYAAPGGYFTDIGPTGALVHFNLWQQGYPIILEALQALTPGLVYTTWSVDPVTGSVVSSQETLPPLTSAEKVLFVGHSGGAHGLMHNIDNLAAALAAIPGFTGDVRALFDANFLPSNNNEVGFDPLQVGTDAYSGLWAGQTAATSNTFTYNGARYWPSSLQKAQYDMIDAVLDTSCMTAHVATGDPWACADRHHVLLNHIATPFFFREDFTDPNKEHTNGGAGHNLQWGDVGAFGHCVVSPCLPILTVAEYREHLEAQFDAMVNSSSTRSEMATGNDPSLGAGNFPTFYAWMPDCGVHEGAFANPSFFDTTISYKGIFNYTMRQWLEGFMSVARTNLRGFRVDGWTDYAGNQMTTTCPP